LGLTAHAFQTPLQNSWNTVEHVGWQVWLQRIEKYISRLQTPWIHHFQSELCHTDFAAIHFIFRRGLYHWLPHDARSIVCVGGVRCNWITWHITVVMHTHRYIVWVPHAPYQCTMWVPQDSYQCIVWVPQGIMWLPHNAYHITRSE